MDELKLLESVPVRLTKDERIIHRSFLNALDISEYVDNVDVNRHSKNVIIKIERDEFYKLTVSMLLATPFFRVRIKKLLKRACDDKRTVFLEAIREYIAKGDEICRRYKRLNPTFMRSSFGKLMWLLMDLKAHETSYSRPLTVGRLLNDCQCSLEQLSRSPVFWSATDPNVSAAERHRLLKDLKTTHGEALGESFEAITQSVTDSREAILAKCRPIKRILAWLREFRSSKNGTDLSIYRGQEGCCFSHGHTQQYQFVHNTLVLWIIIQENMNALWEAIENDLLNPNLRYHFVNTGQGHQRLQKCPETMEAAQRCLSHAQSQVGGWIGSDVIHLGDHDVPNALVFIDKYTQVPLILGEIVSVLDHLERQCGLYESVKISIERMYGSIEATRTVILRDFFRLGFNGSGDDGGSCIDGRLTSTWNWCSLLEKKKFYPIFLMCGFTGFDGQF